MGAGLQLRLRRDSDLKLIINISKSSILVAKAFPDVGLEANIFWLPNGC